MPKSEDEIRKSIKEYEKNLPDNERNLNVKQTVDRIIARAAQPIESKLEKPQHSDSYSDKQTRSRKAEDTSD